MAHKNCNKETTQKHRVGQSGVVEDHILALFLDPSLKIIYKENIY